ncbi:MAG: ABC transporter permease [Actinobacteria bacterium]|nr:ABC transporter permease [Actinomycetota bacterium]
MLKNYILTALRSIKRQKLYSVIIISGLAVGLAIFILASTLFSFHLSFDKFHKDSDGIYIILAERETLNGVHQKDMYTHLPIASLMEQNFSEIENATVFRKYFREIFRYKENIFYENDVLFTEPNFFKVFTYPIINGDKDNPLAKPNSVVLTESTAIKYFGHDNPVGKMLEADFSETPLKVMAIIKDCPLNTSMPFDMLVSLPENYKNDWHVAGSTYTFVKLKDNVKANSLDSKLPEFVEDFLPLQREEKVRLFLFPLKNIHLKSLDINSGFNITAIFQFHLIIGIAIGLLIIAAINFMVLSTSRYSSQAKEVGVRKAVGANKWQLILRYISESVILALLALFLAFLNFELVAPAFEAMIGSIDLNLWQKPFLVSLIFFVTLLVGIVSGIYPAFFLSALDPGRILKKEHISLKSGVKFRKILVLFQFALAFIMIAFTLNSLKHLDMLSKINLGYSRENIITVSVDNSFYSKFDVLENELKKNPNISVVASAHVLPFSWHRQDKIRPEGTNKTEAENIYSYPCGYNFTEAINIKIVKGRSFSREFNDENSMIISEETVKHFGWDDPIGKVLVFDERHGAKKKVIGVAKDFHFLHVFFKKAPAVIFFRPEEPFYVYIKTLSKPDDDTIIFIEATWRRVLPDLPFEYSILDYAFQESLRDIKNIIDIFKYIVIISVFIAGLGLFALASYTVERKTKEIGIRKVLGASISKITTMLISEFLFLVVAANIMALPAAYYLTNYFGDVGWVYKTELTFSICIIAAIISVASALLAVGAQSVKAAMTDPVKALRYE